MRIKILLLGFILSIPVMMHAQLGDRIMNRVKNKVNQRADQKIDKAIDKTLDNAEGRNRNSKPSPSPKQKNDPVAKPKDEVPNKEVAPANEPAAAPETPVARSYVKYDFVAGEELIYINNFETDKMGELPAGWNTNGNGVITTIENLPGNWMQFSQNSSFLTENTASFTDNFTLEFDIVLRRLNPKAVFPQIAFGVMSAGNLSTTDNQLLKNYKQFAAVELKLQPYDNQSSNMHLETYEKWERHLNTDIRNFASLQQHFNKPLHVAIHVQKERLRVWFNEEKHYDLPKAIAPGTIFNQLYFSVLRYGSDDNEVGYSISNIKVAKGLPDTRHKLVEEGKFSTTGILFDVNEAKIKPESAGILAQIADVLKKSPGMRVKIIGHTDSDGGAEENMTLSRNRAAAVKQALQEHYEIDGSRLESDGKGETVPVGENSTREGRAKNRRVEFVKL